ncbi:MAG: hypothetical protein U1F36_04460 [Planctomycetota bacterium]
MANSGYRQLDPGKVVATIARLRDRIRERFPAASLGAVAEDLLQVARDLARRSVEIRRRILPLRLLSGLLILLALGALIGTVALVHPQLGDDWQWSDVIQTLEAGLGMLFFLSAGILYLASLEARAKRSRCLAAIHEMRAMAHIVDMHQLTKDPDHVREVEPALPDTASSPKRGLTRSELVRYLDYCSEMLSLMGKVAAMYVQGFDDDRALAAVDDVEDLTTGLSRKIWQKIMILDARQGV